MSKNRLTQHPILEFKRGKKIKFYFEGKELEAYEGETVASALIASGVKVFSHSKRHNRPRGFFCAIGKCSSCFMEIDGVPNQMTCMRLVQQGMQVRRQEI
ncbi:(2Fe-2S)-binding protein [candidate division WOR-3 bacterium]|nr:(2Fe-2S)-binding protein [candidate division WOR-3 bacterium]